MSEENEISIDRIELGPGWACFRAGQKNPAPELLPTYLNHVFFSWLQRNQEFTVRATLPIVENGNTVAIHVWYD